MALPRLLLCSAFVAGTAAWPGCATPVGSGTGADELATLEHPQGYIRLCIVGQSGELRQLELLFVGLSARPPQGTGAAAGAEPQVDAEPRVFVQSCATWHDARPSHPPFLVAGKIPPWVRGVTKEALEVRLLPRTREVLVKGVAGCDGVSCQLSYQVAREQFPKIFGKLLLEDLAQTSLRLENTALSSRGAFFKAMEEIFVLERGAGKFEAFSDFFKTYYQRLKWSGREVAGRSLTAAVDLTGVLSPARRKVFEALPLNAVNVKFSKLSPDAMRLSEKYLRLLEQLGRTQQKRGWLEFIEAGKDVAEDVSSTTVRTLKVKLSTSTNQASKLLIEEARPGAVREALERIGDPKLRDAVAQLKRQFATLSGQTHRLDLPTNVDEWTDAVDALLEVARVGY